MTEEELRAENVMLRSVLADLIGYCEAPQTATLGPNYPITADYLDGLRDRVEKANAVLGNQPKEAASEN